MPVPQGQELHLRHSSELEIGDIVYITFSFNHLAYWKFGAEESLKVIEKTKDNKVRMVAEDGTVIPERQNPPIGGTREEMLNEIRSLSNFNEIKVIRPIRQAQKVSQRENQDHSMADMRQQVGEAPSIFPTVPVLWSTVAVGLAYYIAKQSEQEE